MIEFRLFFDSLKITVYEIPPDLSFALNGSGYSKAGIVRGHFDYFISIIFMISERPPDFKLKKYRPLGRSFAL